MRAKNYLVLLSLALMLIVPQLVVAGPYDPVHDFDCQDCHKQGGTINELGGGNVCLNCHGGTAMSFAPLNPARGAVPPSGGTFVDGDASNQYGNNLAHTSPTFEQTSHNWAAPSVNPAAGAVEPNAAGFSSRWRTTAGKVACSRCHNPHGLLESNPGLLLLSANYIDPMTPNDMCLACHDDFKVQTSDGTLTNHGILSHPMVADYATATVGRNAGKYKTADAINTANVSGTGIQLVDGGVTCLSCHGLHFVDSDAQTADGVAATGTGDGLLLRGDGMNFVNDPTRGNSFCNTCHNYVGMGMHGSTAAAIGCMGCHGGHNYDSKFQPGNNGDTSYFMLPNSYTSVPDDLLPDVAAVSAKRTDFMGGTLPGVLDGLCETCHGDFEGNFELLAEDTEYNHLAAGLGECDSCHLSHGDGAYSKPSGCDSCHASPPRDATEGSAAATGTTGSAWDDVGTFFQYSVTSALTNGGITPIDETNSGHAKHAYPADAGNYAFACDECHKGNNHNGTEVLVPSFQDVFKIDTGLIATIGSVTAPQAGFTPTYAGGTNDCSSLYCHSDGVTARAGGATANLTVPNWDKGSALPTTDCTSCHIASTTGTASMHTIHIGLSDLGVTCGSCHNLTSLDGLNLEATATGSGGIHVDGTVDLDFDAANPNSTPPIPSGYAPVSGTCGLYCHSDGTTYVEQPDWDDANTGNCGDCHRATALDDNGAINTGAHTKHVEDLGFACDVCHTHKGDDFGGALAPDHINGNLDLKNGDDTCAECHGAKPPSLGAPFGVGADLYPTWESPSTTVTCETCHSGLRSVINAATAPLVAEDAYDNGHGKVGVACTDCHDAALDPDHLDGAATDRLDTSLPAYAAGNDVAFCTDCHGATTNNHSDADGTVCKTCHNQHGEDNGFDAMIMSTVDGKTVTGFGTQGARASYANAANTGICQTCHTPATGIQYFNTATNDQTHNAGLDCDTCHSHDSTPKAFAGAGNACDACHGFPPATAAHAKHAPVSDALASPVDFVTYPALDRSACAGCHTGADLYTYSYSDDQTSGTPGQINHNAGDATQVATLGTSVGYNNADGSCAIACHRADNTRADWAVAALACDSCHREPPRNGGGDNSAHEDHILAGLTCLTCHGVNPSDTVHIDAKTGADEWTKVSNMTDQTIDAAAITDASWNGTNKTCDNTAWHNPSDDAHIADWDDSVSSCKLCHGSDVASGDAMTSLSHDRHVDNAAVIGDNAVCTDCHAAAGSTAHRDGTLQVLAGLNYSGEVGIPTSGVGTCNTNTCHTNDGTPRITPNWGDDANDDCVTCHRSGADITTAGPIPSRGDHTEHWISGRFTNGLECASCHVNTVNPGTLTIIPSASGGLHMDGSSIDAIPAGAAAKYSTVDVAFTYNDAPSPSTCATTSCHGTAITRVWSPPSGCVDCHGNLSDKGPVHTAHIDISTSIQNDRSECVVCHGSQVNSYGLSGGGDPAHDNKSTDFAAGISNTTCTNACHSSDGTDGFWTDPNGLSCDACHAEPPADQRHTKHVTDSGMACTDYHGTVDAAGTHPLTHNHSKDEIGGPGITDDEALITRGKDYINNGGQDIAVDDAAWNGAGPNTFVNSSVTNDAGNNCSNTMCHDPSDNGTVADWDVANANGCAFCHGDDGTVAILTSGSHERHLDATAKFGLTIDCNRCHPTNAVNDHFMTSGPTAVNGQVQFGGSVISAAGSGNSQYSGDIDLPNSAVAVALQFGTCGTNACHNNGTGSGAPVATYEWNAAVATDCQTCHVDPPITGRHATHLGASVSYGPYAGTASTNCGDCHDANNDLTMTGKADHIDGSINFSDGNNIATGGIQADGAIAACNTCHGGQAAADLAKAQWDTSNRLSCESCHGDNSAANSQAAGGGVDAPLDAGTPYTDNGHGMTATPASAIGGSKPVLQACNDCHDNTDAHISGTLGDDTRLDPMGGITYSVDPNGWCNDCHTGLGSSEVHYDNTHTTNGASDDAVTCVTCHDQHGQNGGQDAMIASTIQTRSVTGFTDRTARGSYSNPAPFDGVCQVCHDQNAPDSILYFNRATETPGHQSGNCLTCHKHTDTPIFKPSGCSSCHGDVVSGAYWPDGSDADPDDNPGRHLKHMEELAAEVYGQNITTLLTDTGGTSDLKQTTLCAYCHTGPGVTNHNNATVNVNSMFSLWDGATPDVGIYTAATNSGSCATVDCHNNQTTPSAGYGWNGAAVTGTARCLNCHETGAANDLANNNIHPNSALHTVTNIGTVQQHNENLPATGCLECHDTALSSTHINGAAVADGGNTNNATERFVVADVNYVEGVLNQTTCSPQAGLAGCHSDEGAWARQWSNFADSTSTAIGTTRCDVCHGQLNDWRGGLTVTHDTALINADNHAGCEQCHVAPTAPYAFGTNHENDLVEVNNNAAMHYIETAGSCDVAICHGAGAAATRTIGDSTIFDANLLGGAGVSCNLCHDSSGGFAGNRYAHAVHVTSAATGPADYIDPSIKSVAGNYSFGCGNCHLNDATAFNDHHNDGVVDLSLNNSNGGVLKGQNNIANDTGGYIQADTSPGNGGSVTCSAAYCHSDSEGTFATTPNWSAILPSFTGDRCAQCHTNSPSTSSHSAHVVAIHYQDVYTGTTDLVNDGTNNNAHGDPAKATTIDCALCHFTTTINTKNDENAVCITCHGSYATPQGTPDIVDKAMHVNGQPDVAFRPVPIRSPAQLRDNIADAPEVGSNWSRFDADSDAAPTPDLDDYKNANGLSHDITPANLDTATMYNSGSKNCTVACHNNNVITWGQANVSCNNCHTELPK